MSSDGNSLIGIYSQRIAGPLNFHRTDAPTPAPQPYEAFYDPPRPPLTADDVQHALDTDVINAIKSGAFARETSVDVAVGVYSKGARRIVAYGAAKPEAIFELGSLTKTFTGLVLAQMVVQGKVRLDEPIRELWPSDTVAKPGGAEVTLLDLITHRSGLPSWPDNPAPPGPDNPYPNYSTAMLHEFVAKHGVAKPADASFQYSNLGAGLLGQALADHSATTYSNLVAAEITQPLGMTDTAVRLSAKQQERFIRVTRTSMYRRTGGITTRSQAPEGFAQLQPTC